MATPSSSTTTPSPQPRYLQPNTVVNTSTLASNGIKLEDKEERERAVQKFIARAEMAKVCRRFSSSRGLGQGRVEAQPLKSACCYSRGSSYYPIRRPVLFLSLNGRVSRVYDPNICSPPLFAVLYSLLALFARDYRMLRTKP